MGMGKKKSAPAPAPVDPGPTVTDNETRADDAQKRGIPVQDGGPVAAQSLLADTDNPRKRAPLAPGGGSAGLLG